MSGGRRCGGSSEPLGRLNQLGVALEVLVDALRQGRDLFDGSPCPGLGRSVGRDALQAGKRGAMTPSFLSMMVRTVRTLNSMFSAMERIDSPALRRCSTRRDFTLLACSGRPILRGETMPLSSPTNLFHLSRSCANFTKVALDPHPVKNPVPARGCETHAIACRQASDRKRSVYKLTVAPCALCSASPIASILFPTRVGWWKVSSRCFRRRMCWTIWTAISNFSILFLSERSKTKCADRPRFIDTA